MKMRTVAFITAFATPVFAAEPIITERPVAVKVDHLPAHTRARIVEKAAQGPTALITYLHRTRHVNGLRLEDVIVPDEATLAALREAQAKLAKR